MARGVIGTIIGIMLLLTALGGIYYLYYFMFGKSQGSNTLNPLNSQAQGTQAQGTVQPYNTNQSGGKRNKKLKSKRMDTTGIYLLLGAVIVGYITSKFA